MDASRQPYVPLSVPTAARRHMAQRPRRHVAVSHGRRRPPPLGQGASRGATMKLVHAEPVDYEITYGYWKSDLHRSQVLIWSGRRRRRSLGGRFVPHRFVLSPSQTCVRRPP
jgi:hypothetical protein